MRRLLYVATVTNTLHSFLRPFAEHFRAQGWRVDGLAAETDYAKGGLDCFDHVHSIRWSRNPLCPANFLEAGAQVRQLVAREGYDLVHVHTPVAAFISRLALRNLRRRGLKVVYTAHGFHFHDHGSPVANLLYRSLERLAGRWTDRLVVINRADEAAAAGLGTIPREHVRYMPGIGVDTGYYSPEAVSAGQVDAVRAEAGLAPPDRALLMVAEFSPRKNHEQALRAFALLGRPRARLLLAGYGPLMDPMRALARELGIAERVRFLGVRHDIRVLIKACVATVLCSRQEGLPRSVMESLSMGVPAIGTRIRGIRELLEPGAGHLVPLGDAGALAEAMERVLARPEEAARMGRKGREQMRATYDLQHILASHADLYADVLGAGTAQTPEPMPREVSTHAVHRA